MKEAWFKNMKEQTPEYARNMRPANMPPERAIRFMGTHHGRQARAILLRGDRIGHRLPPPWQTPEMGRKDQNLAGLPSNTLRAKGRESPGPLLALVSASGVYQPQVVVISPPSGLRNRKGLVVPLGTAAFSVEPVSWILVDFL